MKRLTTRPDVLAYQADALASPARFTWNCWARQTGKSKIGRADWPRHIGRGGSFTLSLRRLLRGIADCRLRHKHIDEGLNIERIHATIAIHVAHGDVTWIRVVQQSVNKRGYGIDGLRRQFRASKYEPHSDLRFFLRENLRKGGALSKGHG